MFSISERILSAEIKLVGNKSSEVTVESDDYVRNTALGCLITLASFLQLTLPEGLNHLKGTNPLSGHRITPPWLKPRSFSTLPHQWHSYRQVQCDLGKVSSTPVGLLLPHLNTSGFLPPQLCFLKTCIKYELEQGLDWDLSMTKFIIAGQVLIKTSLPDLTLPTAQAQSHTTAMWGLKISQFTDAKQHFPVHCNLYRRSESTKFSLLPHRQLHRELGISHPSILTHHSHITHTAAAPEPQALPHSGLPGSDCTEQPGKFSTGF